MNPPQTLTRLATAHCGGKHRLALIALPEFTQTALVRTTTTLPAAPVIWNQALKPWYAMRALLINSGNANAFTGEQGMDDASKCAQMAADVVGCAAEQVLLASTGVIGERLPVEQLLAAKHSLQQHLGQCDWADAAQAIMTTDQGPKRVQRTLQSCQGHPVVMTGIAKGAGMIEPNMATMLAVVTVNASVQQGIIQAALEQAVDQSFHRITVDGDMSTNDSVFLFAGGHQSVDPSALQTSLNDVLTELAWMIVSDGEGSERVAKVHVQGAQDVQQARHVAKCIANSPLFKTMLNGGDPNWGRIVMAVGKSGVSVQADQIRIFIGSQLVAEKGRVHPQYHEAQAAAYMKQQAVEVSVDLGLGTAADWVWGSDLSAGYLRINSDYRS